jgi:hypothetical protein
MASQTITGCLDEAYLLFFFFLITPRIQEEYLFS